MKSKFKLLVISVMVFATLSTATSAGALCIGDIASVKNLSICDLLSWSCSGDTSTCNSNFLLQLICAYCNGSGNDSGTTETPAVPTPSSQPEVPTQPTKPVEPEVPVEPETPSCPSGTCPDTSDPTCPDGNCDPAEPDDPTCTTGNCGVETPTQPSEPAQPEIPSQPETPTESEKPSSGSSDFVTEVIRLVNVERAKYGLSALTENTALSAVAQLKADDMSKNHYFSHQSPTYGSAFDMMQKAGITYRSAGENIASGYSTPAAVVQGWMNSEGHRANILSSSYTQIGIGYASSGNYWAQMFIG